MNIPEWAFNNRLDLLVRNFSEFKIIIFDLSFILDDDKSPHIALQEYSGLYIAHTSHNFEKGEVMISAYLKSIDDGPTTRIIPLFTIGEQLNIRSAYDDKNLLYTDEKIMNAVFARLQKLTSNRFLFLRTVSLLMKGIIWMIANPIKLYRNIKDIVDEVRTAIREHRVSK